ncbi:TIR domain-containing protein [Roseivivax sediminis]|uniref:TIR domain-containing protein n=1 Tax=Roseivivax sediminis TaxID=936889 RepID=A0A1I1T7J5_9RHOB|nr:toll/interleukin-1 receptor domain-containing protein [Roseivivax sediminis]SFD52253.1 TIR domain-containing protein [Roseivivax sediminis]
MLPPILEIFVIWHPDDQQGAGLAETIFDHFMKGTTFSGVIGGGVQVSLRSAGWEGQDDAPRPIYAEGHTSPNGIRPASFVAIVPLLGIEMAACVEAENTQWHAYVKAIQDLHQASPERVGVFPYAMDSGATRGTKLQDILGAYQFVAAGNPDGRGEDVESMLCRDLTQGITQMISPDEMDRLTAFISHTKRHSLGEGQDVDDLVDLVREVIRNTRLNEFFDANDLQPGTDWDQELRDKSGASAMLALRTDLYSSREWCQREVVIAKTHGMPVIMMDAIGVGEERGSFLMDHVPRIALRKMEGRWRRQDVYRALNLLVDECLKRALWIHQKDLSHERPELDVAWWAPHAPEPLTLSRWIDSYLEQNGDDASDEAIRILHPDPPLGPEERNVLMNYARTTRLGREIDIMTPRQLATRGG